MTGHFETQIGIFARKCLVETVMRTEGASHLEITASVAPQGRHAWALLSCEWEGTNLSPTPEDVSFSCFHSFKIKEQKKVLSVLEEAWSRLQAVMCQRDPCPWQCYTSFSSRLLSTCMRIIFFPDVSLWEDTLCLLVTIIKCPMSPGNWHNKTSYDWNESFWFGDSWFCLWWGFGAPSFKKKKFLRNVGWRQQIKEV